MLNLGRRRKITFSVLVVTSFVLAWLAYNHTRFPGDLQITLALQSFQNQPFLAAMEGISYAVGDWKGIIVIVLAAVIFWRRIGVIEGGVVLLSGLFAAANEIFKLIVNQPRPTADLVKIFVAESGKSFPSGHAFFAVAVLGLIAYLIAMRQSKLWQKSLTAAVSIILILGIGVSRIYLGVHWASDVIGGYVVGAVFLLLDIWLYERLKLRYPDLTLKNS